jgi:hypothetical protein
MPDKATQDDEISRLKARISELEAELHKSKGAPKESSRASESMNDVSRNKIDGLSRMARGLTLASFEGLSIFADSLSALADGVTSRNKASGSTSTRELSRRLPSDIAGGFADAVERMTDLPARAAERYASAHREGAGTERK